ncbi:MAG: DEAD/DEAH box helicase [Salinivirgaceae bacterium]|nr:DEAD/DEAH box helicase [Salinivirgaceae bacterium]
MDAFRTHEKVIADYRSYLNSFLSIQDKKIKDEVGKAFNDDGFIPEPLIQFNPSFDTDKPLQYLVDKGKAHKDLPLVFGEYKLYRHQIEALEKGIDGNGFIVTSGTGSGKSLTFLATIFNDIIQQGAEKKLGIKAILVYPMNALINSQEEEIKKYHINYLKSRKPELDYHPENKSLDVQITELEELTGAKFPITYASYTGQHQGVQREKLKSEKPDIILTNYMMLELIMTRLGEAWMRDSFKDHLKYLVFDELHTYRGRQGSDVALLVRRIKGLCSNKIVCIGTSATMMSAGTPMEKKKAVAGVGKTIFGEIYHPDAIVGEYLKPFTKGLQPSKKELEESVNGDVDVLLDEDEFINHPITNWLESQIALKDNNGIVERGKPLSISGISQKLHSIIGGDVQALRSKLIEVLKWTEKLNEKNRVLQSGKSFLPFRFHQFISQTSVVLVTLNSREQREITINPGRYIKTKEGEKLLYPVLFSRISGYDFICVEKDVEKNKFKPRTLDEKVQTITQKEAKGLDLNEEHFKYGYLVLDEGEEFWNEDTEQYVPESWMNSSGTTLKDFYKWQMPQRVYFDEEGNYSEQEIYPLKGYYISAKLRIDPTAGVVYEDVKTGENTKLMRIGNEGRSTATTILSYSVVDSLFEQGENYADQKLLSFTDNRQDASLQAGHFNDFLATIKLRSGVYKALQKEDGPMDVHKIHERVFDALQLVESNYAKYPSEDADFTDADNDRAIKNYLLLRIFQDLKRGWRYTLPNLEQTALLKIEYRNLKKLASLDDRFVGLELFNIMNSEQREETLIQVLNYFRTNFSLDHRMLLQDRGETESLLKNKLDDNKLWSLDKDEKIDTPRYLVVNNPGRTQRGIYTASIGPRSGLGKFIKRKYQEMNLSSPNQEELVEVIEELCLLLSKTNFLSRKEGIKGDRNKDVGVTGFLLRTDCILWHLGDSKTVGIDQTRINNFNEITITPNPYFQNLYKKDFTKYLKEFEGREHTGQLSSSDRIEREKRFTSGDISSLFCSPTMELGIDIANLNIVHMRNVPPNPANYAQRSGRAGRSGQTAVVFTFCSAGSPHDQNYFRASDTMVSGSVVPPRIDLLNQELIRTHFHAYLLMEMELENLNNSVSTLVDLEDNPHLKLKQLVNDHITNNLDHYKTRWSHNFQNYISELLPELKDVWWYTDNWFIQQANGFLMAFNSAFDRWRILYRSAKKMMHDSHIILNDPTIKDKEMKRDAKRQYNVGLRQTDLLTNETKATFGGQSEFYVFRYLASEGFIPGYNFTRLPVRAFVGYKHEDQGEYISRARSIALREFGPNNIIYHNGSKHRIVRMMTTDADALQRKIKISKETGYVFLDDQAQKANNDPITHTELKGDNAEYRTKLIEISESEAIPQNRISCEEEERMSTGFEIDHYFNYPSGIEQTKKAVVQKGGQSLLNLIYGPATELVHLNRKWNRSPEDSFSIDERTGKWLRKKDLEDDTIKDHEKKVMVFARETADTLYIQPLANLEVSKEQIISLSYALKRAIETIFQVEEREIGVSIIGQKEKPNVMIYESAEGSLGILSQLVADPLKLKELFTVAYSCMHFDLDSREETELGKSLPKASYQDLLSYFNQRHHETLDRHSIKEVLEYLMDCTISQNKEGKDREEQYNYLLESYDKNSSTELKLLKYLYNNGLALPDKAQVNVPEFYISADFTYNTPSGPVLVFCDGSVHDDNIVKEDDSHKRSLLYAAGYDVIEWHYKETVETLVERRKDIFRKVC